MRTEAWAVVINNQINVRSVSPTRIAAMVNYLCTDKGFIALNTTTDSQVEKLWQYHKGNAELKRVEIYIIGERQPEELGGMDW